MFIHRSYVMDFNADFVRFGSCARTGIGAREKNRSAPLKSRDGTRKDADGTRRTATDIRPPGFAILEGKPWSEPWIANLERR